MSTCFTDVEERIKVHRQTNLLILFEDQLSEMKEAKHFWQREMLMAVDNQYENYFRTLIKSKVLSESKRGSLIQKTNKSIQGFLMKLNNKRKVKKIESEKEQIEKVNFE